MSDRAPAPFFRLWLAETVRLREAHWGLVDDQDAVRQARQGGGTFADRLQTRAEVIGARDNILQQLALWRTGGFWTLTALTLIAVVAGALTASGALGNPAQSVNILWALGALLGLHTLTFVLWLGSLVWGGGAHGLGAAWLWLTRKLARGPQSRLIPTAFVNLLAQAGARAAFFGVITHLFWLVALVSAIGMLVLLLSTAQYRFMWATTLLEPQAFVGLTRGLGALPGWLGFPSPDVPTILASDGRSTLGGAAHAQWSLWLLGVVLAYGVLPRLIALTVCFVRLRRALRGLELDTRLPGLTNLRERLMPSPPAEPATPTPSVHHPHVDSNQLPMRTSGLRLAATLELPATFSWPPAALAADSTLTDAGALDTREQRRHLLDALAEGPAERLLVVCDRRQTPDRGTIGLITELAAHTNAIQIWLADTTVPNPTPDTMAADGLAPEIRPVVTPSAEPSATLSDRSALWREQLNQAGLGDDAIALSPTYALQWLQERSE